MTLPISKEFLKKDVAKSWKVKSYTKDDVWYEVELLKDGSWRCSCPSFKECKHIKDKKATYNLKDLWKNKSKK